MKRKIILNGQGGIIGLHNMDRDNLVIAIHSIGNELTRNAKLVLLNGEYIWQMIDNMRSCVGSYKTIKEAIEAVESIGGKVFVFDNMGDYIHYLEEKSDRRKQEYDKSDYLLHR